MSNKPFFISDEYNRSFGGKLTGFESREEAMQEKKHLKAYLAGRSVYRHGYETVETSFGMERQPKYYPVKENWTPKNQK